MPRIIQIRTLFLVLASVILTACSSSGELKVNHALNESLDHNAVAELDVIPVFEEDADEDDREEADEVAQRLRGELFGRLVAEGVFKQVYHKGQSEGARYNINVKIDESDEVSQGARIFFGALAGANELVVHVSVSDTQSQMLLTDFVVTGESASHPLSSESGMDAAIREAVDEILLALR